MVLLCDNERQSSEMRTVFFRTLVNLPEKRLVRCAIDQRFDVQISVVFAFDRKTLHEIKGERMRGHEIAGNIEFAAFL